MKSILVSLASLALFVVGCEGKKEETVDLTKFSGLYKSYLSSCKDCHEPGNITYKDNVKNLDMSSEDAAYNSLMSVANVPRLAGLGCDASLKYVAAGSSASSILYAIMDATTADNFGNGACRPLKHTKADGGEANTPTTEQKQKIKEWIDKGAPRN